MPGRLVDRAPEVGADELVAALVPPPRFSEVRFTTYLPDPGEPSQATALAVLQDFATEIAEGPGSRWLGRRRKGPGTVAGRYLDGGFGVGKTHLLASLWHAVDGPKAYGTFVELTSLVGALGFAETVSRLSELRLLCVDEFELDDPGDTVLVSTLLGRLVDAGVRLAATSNTQPEDLGARRFAADDFLREIQGLAGHFQVVTVDGPDYRHRGLPPAPPPASEAEIAVAAAGPATTEDQFGALCDHLARLHPSRYGALVRDLRAVCLHDVRPVSDQDTALRLVVLVDRLYDSDCALVAGGVAADQLFPPDLLAGPHRKKYLRCMSRWTALARQGTALSA